MAEILDRIGELGIVPVVAIESIEHVTGLARALLAGGLPCVEITFRTPTALAAIRRIADEYPELLVGAGTVLSLDQVGQATEAGARFVVAPGFNPKVVDWCVERSVPITPGVVTPSEIDMALDRGLHILKFFPAEALGGVSLLKAISAPYRDVKFIPTGGINASNLADYLRLPTVHACGGSWMVNKALISAGRFQEIRKLVEQAVQIVHSVRKPE